MGAGARRSVEGQEEWRPQVTAGAPLLAPTCALGPLLAWPEGPHGACRGDVPGYGRRVDEQAAEMWGVCLRAAGLAGGSAAQEGSRTKHPEAEGAGAGPGGAAQHGQREHRLSAPRTLGLAPER